MKVAKENIEVKMNIPGVVMRQRKDFGDVSGYGKIGCEYFSLAKGVDTTQLFVGLEGNQCQCPHWGYVLSGNITTTDSSGKEETVNTNDMFYWPAGHNVKVNSDSEIIMFSPQDEHTHVINHLIEKTKG